MVKEKYKDFAVSVAMFLAVFVFAEYFLIPQLILTASVLPSVAMASASFAVTAYFVSNYDYSDSSF